MNTAELASLFRILGILSDEWGDATFSKVTNDSRQVTPGALFAAIRGQCSDGHDFIPQAIAAGASAILYVDPKTPIPEGVASIQVTDGYFAHAVACEYVNGFPAAQMTLGAVTGTNGKTTTVFLLRALIEAGIPDARCGLLSTVHIVDGEHTYASEHTTPSAEVVQSVFRAMADHGCSHAVMEQSSHGLDQHRTGTALFDVTIFTNLTGDHLDYHGTMEAYGAAKRRLFTDNLAPGGTAVINTDDAFGRQLYDDLKAMGKRVAGFGFQSTDGIISNPRYSLNGTQFELLIDGKKYAIHSQFIGEYNVLNLCGAMFAAKSLGASFEQLVEVVNARRLPEVPGRMERISHPIGAECFVDFAHTDDALERAITALRAVTPGRVIVLFGCGGDRDRTKRPRMGKVASLLADAVVITSDNPRSENPLDIITEIKCGISAPYAGKIHSEPDRRKAIALAISMLRKDDALLVAGKGHENTQEIRGVHHPFDDRQVVTEEIALISPQP